MSSTKKKSKIQENKKENKKEGLRKKKPSFKIFSIINTHLRLLGFRPYVSPLDITVSSLRANRFSELLFLLVLRTFEAELLASFSLLAAKLHRMIELQ